MYLPLQGKLTILSFEQLARHFLVVDLDPEQERNAERQISLKWCVLGSLVEASHERELGQRGQAKLLRQDCEARRIVEALLSLEMSIVRIGLFGKILHTLIVLGQLS